MILIESMRTNFLFAVHCSAGIGRSGTLILVDTCLVLASQGVNLSLDLVLDTLLDLRTYRLAASIL